MEIESLSMLGITNLNGVIREGLTDYVKFEQKLEEAEGRPYQLERTAMIRPLQLTYLRNSKEANLWDWSD